MNICCIEYKRLCVVKHILHSNPLSVSYDAQENITDIVGLATGNELLDHSFTKKLKKVTDIDVYVKRQNVELKVSFLSEAQLTRLRLMQTL